MIRVANGGCIRNLSAKSLRAARTRNLVAAAAIALTAVLFTTLFTVALSINASFQQANFRQCGGWSQGTFKYLTQEQYDRLRGDPLIRQYGLRRFVGMPQDAPFHKAHVEVGYSDAAQAHWMYCDPAEGRLPQEGTDEAATDTRVLGLLGVEPEIGAQFTLTFPVDGTETTQTFTLSGWWEYDEAIVASHVLIPESRADAIFEKLGTQGLDGMTARWNLDVMFASSLHIEGDMERVLENHGYQGVSPGEGDNYISAGVNWGYSGAQLTDNLDAPTAAAIGVILALIVLTGYLIIYNVFQISVAGDIRFYGLLKTVGTTPRQLRRILRRQALALSVAGIPAGLLGGWLVGAKLTPVVLNRLNGVVRDTVSLDPKIFALSALFALGTVLLSCARPARLAGKVSPIEAIRRTEGAEGRRRGEKRSGSVSLRSMAWANLGRSRGKTAVTVLSLSLAVVLLNLTVIFALGFNMDKYLSRKCVSDFILSSAAYFQVGGEVFSADTALPQTAIDAAAARGIADGGRVYGRTSWVQESVAEDYYRQKWSRWNEDGTLDFMVGQMERRPDGALADGAQLYGMEAFVRNRLTVLEGDLSSLDQPGARNIAAVYHADDYGKPEWDSHWAKLGDRITLRYVEEYEYFNPQTGELYDGWESIGDEPWRERAARYRDVTYTVTALVSVPAALSYRYYGEDEFVLNDQTFLADTGTDAVMLYAFDAAEGAEASMESFLRDYTQTQAPQYDYESRSTYAAEFESTRAMFLLLGGALSLIVGLVGALNFFNAVLTGILTRRREFAVLQSIGMTGRQLKRMLVWEGLCYALGASALSLALNCAMGPLLKAALESVYWFFAYRFTVWPILLMMPALAALGWALPLAVYRFLARQTIVERLREAE